MGPGESIKGSFKTLEFERKQGPLAPRVAEGSALPLGGHRGHENCGVTAPLPELNHRQGRSRSRGCKDASPGALVC